MGNKKIELTQEEIDAIAEILRDDIVDFPDIFGEDTPALTGFQKINAASCFGVTAIVSDLSDES